MGRPFQDEELVAVMEALHTILNPQKAASGDESITPEKIQYTF
jgi:hypothetical protein